MRRRRQHSKTPVFFGKTYARSCSVVTIGHIGVIVRPPKRRSDVRPIVTTVREASKIWEARHHYWDNGPPAKHALASGPQRPTSESPVTNDQCEHVMFYVIQCDATTGNISRVICVDKRLKQYF